MKKSALFFTLAMLIAPCLAYADITFGVAANRGELKAKEEWTELASLLSKGLGTPVTLMPVTVENSIQAFGDKKVDFMIANPVVSAVVVEKFKGKPLATVNTDQGYEFGGVIFANKASGVSKIEDMKGKKVMSYTKDSAGAYIFQAYEIKKKGIDMDKDFASLTIAKKQNDIPMAVKAGVFDVGFVRTGVLEAMEKSGTLKLDDFVIVSKVSDSFGHVHSTPLYPEWFLVAQEGADPAVSAKVASIVLALKPDDEAVKKASIKGFVAPRDVVPLVAVLKDMKVPPYDK